MTWWIWVLIALGFAVLLFVVSGVVAGHLAVHKIYGRRYNGNPNLKYFSADDFPGLFTVPISFMSGGTELHGYIYTYGARLSVARETADRAGAPKGLVVFSLGFGAGHTSYTTEIAALARAGFAVLAFDNTGCMSSGGNSLLGFDRGVLDLLAAMSFAENDERLNGLKIALVGHSWGAFSVMNAFPLAKNVRCAVAMCGFVCGADVLAQNVFGRFAPLRWLMSFAIRCKSRAVFGKAANFRSDRSLKGINRPVYLLYGKKDTIVRFRWNGKKMAKAMRGEPSVKVRLFENKGHNVYLTENAENKMHAVFGAIAKTAKKDKARAAAMYKEVDYPAITEEDGEVMESIVGFIEENL